MKFINESSKIFDYLDWNWCVCIFYVADADAYAGADDTLKYSKQKDESSSSSFIGGLNQIEPANFVEIDTQTTLYI